MEGAQGWGRIRGECRFHSLAMQFLVSCVVSTAPTGRTVWLAALPRGRLKLGEARGLQSIVRAEICPKFLPLAYYFPGEVAIPFPHSFLWPKHTYHKGVWGRCVPRPWWCEDREKTVAISSHSLPCPLHPFPIPLWRREFWARSSEGRDLCHQGFAPLCLEHPPIETLLTIALLS